MLLQEPVQTALKAFYTQHATIEGFFGKPLPLEQHHLLLEMLPQGHSTEDAEPIASSALSNRLFSYKGSRADAEPNPPSVLSDRLSSDEDHKPVRKTMLVMDLLKSDQTLSLGKETNSPSTVLIQGHAGIGKTTFTRSLAYEWAMGRLFTEFSWVFLFNLRDLPTISDKTISLGRWVYLQFFEKTGIEESTFAHVWENVIQPAALIDKQLLFIFDGLDECQEEHPCKKLLNQLLFVDALQCIPKIITLRPCGLSHFPEKCRTIEIRGFSDAHIESYLQQYFVGFSGSTPIVQEILSLLKANVYLWDIAHIPLQLNLLCALIEKSLVESIDKVRGTLERLSSLTSIYQSLEGMLLKRAYQLEEHYQLAEQGLSTLAFYGMSRVLADFGIPGATLESMEKLGFIKPVISGLHLEKEKRSYEFLHFTFQEYYAAKYIANVLTEPQNSRRAHLIDILLKEKLNPRWKIVFWFVAGLLKDQSEAFVFYIHLLSGSVAGLPLAQDLFQDYELGLLARCLDEAGDLPNLECVRAPVRERIQNRIAQVCVTGIDLHSHFIRELPVHPLSLVLSISPSWLKATGPLDLLAKIDVESQLGSPHCSEAFRAQCKEIDGLPGKTLHLYPKRFEIRST